MATESVYVAAASSEWERAKLCMDWVREQPHLDLAYDWVADVIRERVEGGRSDSDLTKEQQHRLAWKDMEAVKDCDVLWLLVPRNGEITVGAWVEFGGALALQKRVIVSGGNVELHLFCALATKAYPDDTDVRNAWGSGDASERPFG